MFSFIVIFSHFTCYDLFTDTDFVFLLLLRTLITGMVSGSIVAFNIDFNRWHYEHQNRYWSQTDPRDRRQVWSRETPTNQAVLLTIHRARKRSSELGNNSMVVTLLKIRVSLHVFIWPLRRTCCWTICWFSCLTWTPADAFPQPSRADLLFWARRELNLN